LEKDFIKCVIGLFGDYVVCCDVVGWIMVNDSVVDEFYVMFGDVLSSMLFDIVVL